MLLFSMQQRIDYRELQKGESKKDLFDRKRK
jgi:hypothetical protein